MGPRRWWGPLIKQKDTIAEVRWSFTEQLLYRMLNIPSDIVVLSTGKVIEISIYIYIYYNNRSG